MNTKELIGFAREVAGDWEHEGLINDTDLYVDIIVRLAALAEQGLGYEKRLAAVEAAVENNQWIRKAHGVTRANDLRPRGYCTDCGDKHPCDPIGLLEDIEAALQGG